MSHVATRSEPELPDNNQISMAGPADFIALLKPRVMSLVIFTALTGMAVAPHTLHPLLAFFALIAIAVGAGASGAFNMWYDADIDALMSRTKKRPIPSGAVTSQETLAFGMILSGFSVLTLGFVANWLSRRRCPSPDDRLCRDERFGHVGKCRSVSHYFHVDPAPFLGLGSRQIGRL